VIHAVAKPRLVDPVAAFRERAEARALLWSLGEYTLHEAVDGLQADAERDGLPELIGSDEVQQIIAQAFAPFREVQP
jgi:hypothetical protein